MCDGFLQIIVHVNKINNIVLLECKSICFFRVNKLFNGVGFCFMFIVMDSFLSSEELTPGRGRLLLFNFSDGLGNLFVFLDGFFWRFGADKFGQFVKKFRLVFVLFQELIDLNVIGDHFFWVNKAVPLSMRFSVSSILLFR